MKPVEARVDDETLDAIQVARGRVPIADFRLRIDCEGCTLLSEQPVGTSSMEAIYAHIAEAHKGEVRP